MNASDRPLRIALLAYRGKATCGGQGVYVRHLSRELTALGHRVDVLAGPPYPTVDPGVRLRRLPGLDLFAEPNPFRTPAAAELRRLPDWVEFLGMKTGGFPEPLAFSLRALACLRRHHAEYDLVHDNQGLGYGLLGLQPLGLPLLATIHHPVAIDRDLELREAEPTRAAQLMRWYRFLRMQHRVARRLTTVLTVSHAARHAIIDRMRVRPVTVHVVPAGVDHATFHPDPAIRKVPGRVVTTASADVPLKGLTTLLQALAEIPAGRDPHLVVVGAGPHERTRALIDRLGLTDRVSFRAGLTDHELADLLRSAEIACVPSRFEGFSLPALEAMACATALVTTTAGALPEVTGADGHAALHVPPDHPAALAAALTRLLDQPALRARLGARGTARAASFGWRATAEATARSYRDVLDRTGSVSPFRGASPRC